MGLMIEGSIHTSSYDDKDGNKRYKTEIKAREVCVTRGDGQGPNPSSGARGAPAGGGYGAGRAPAPAQGDAYEGDGGDIPY
jgi:single-strand DNA-binding protein